MKRLVVLLALLAPTVASAQQPLDASRIFSHQADVLSSGSAEVFRLPLSPEVLAICRADLSDVRLFDSGGTEVPWILDSASRADGARGQQLGEASAPILETTTHTIERSTTIPWNYHEVYEIPAPGAPPSRASWELVVGTVQDHFVADVRIVAIENGVERELAHASAFRFPTPTRERVRFAVDVASADHVRVEIVGHDGFLEPGFTWVASRHGRAGEELVVPLTITDRAQRDGTTVLTIERPIGVLPEALRFTTATGTFYRSIQIASGGTSLPGAIWRVPGPSDAESLDVAAPVARETTMIVSLDDGDSPPLADLSVAAVLSRPVIVFFAPAQVLRFGGGRVRAPRYDVAALRGSWAIDQLLDGSMAPEDAALGPIRSSSGFTDDAALAPMQRAGVVVPAGEHAFVAPLEVSAAREGASRFVLDAPSLAAARDDLADLRIVDAAGAQWPYVLREADPLVLAVPISTGTRDVDETRYEITLPAGRVTPTELRVDPDAALVSRSVRVMGTDERGDEVELTNGFLARDPSMERAPLTIAIGAGRRYTSLALLVSDGSETPLVFASAALVLPTREVVLVAPPGGYHVLVGSESATAPSYEIESVRSLLDTIPLDDATLGALAPNPSHHEPSFWERTGSSTLGLWALLVIAILVLGALTWRASQMPDPPKPAPPQREDSPPDASG